MTAPSPPRKIAWFLGPPRWSAEEDGRSYPHHKNNLDSNASCKDENEIHEICEKNMVSDDKRKRIGHKMRWTDKRTETTDRGREVWLFGGVGVFVCVGGVADISLK